MRVFEGYQKGVNLGGWISQYARYDTEHFDTFITEKDLREIAALGFDHVRVPLDYPVVEEEDGTLRPDGFKYLFNCRDWCRKYGLKMVIDMHECYGYTFDPLKDIDRMKLFVDAELQARYLNLWKEIAVRFRDDADMVAFEPLNEVVKWEAAEPWNELVDRYVKMIREICPKHWLIIGGVCYNSVTTVSMLGAPADDHIVYNFHCYEPMVFTHQGAFWVDYMPRDFRTGYPQTLEEYRAVSRSLSKELAGAIFQEGIGEIGPDFFETLFKPALDYAQQHNVPLYCGEYGVIELAANEDKIRWLRDIHSVFRKYQIGHALWNYKQKDFGFVDESFASVRDDFIACL